MARRRQLLGNTVSEVTSNTTGNVSSSVAQLLKVL